jgi:hypothetical protein
MSSILEAYAEYLSDPDAIKRAEQFEGYKTMIHPTYPLRERESAEITVCIETFGSLRDIAAIMTKYRNYCDADFPGWRERYDAEMKQWFAANGQTFPCSEQP